MAPYQTHAALVITMSAAAISMQFALLPDTLDLRNFVANDVGVTSSTAQECVDLVAAAEPAALAISFDSTTGACKYGTSIYSYYTRSTGQQPAYYLRTDNITKQLSVADCLTIQDGEYLIAMLSFGDDECVPSMSTYDSVSGLCTSTDLSDYDLGAYAAGRFQDGTLYTLSRDKALEAVSYECSDDAMRAPWFFGGAWYCYVAFGPSKIAVEDVRENACASTSWKDSAMVKISEAREYGFLRYLWPSYTNIYLGLYLQGRASYWYDGSVATGLPWAVGRPLDGAVNDMVSLTSDLSVVDGSGNDTDVLCCKKAAANLGYHPTTKFVQ
ncbi:hypothetical protein AAVH_24988 [Aphelenchoides avenae]|nr:hypothetical protein AAVH_24988 [Aphelenchus avenae]